MRCVNLPIPLLLLCTSCAGPLINSGGYQVSQKWFQQDMDQIRPRAAFALDCAGDKIEGVVLAVMPTNSAAPGQIGVSGCGHRAVFVPRSEGWEPSGVTK